MRGNYGPISEVRVSQLTGAQQRSLIEFVRTTQPRNVGLDMCRALSDRGLIRTTGPQHRSYHLTALGKEFAMTILARKAGAHVRDDVAV